MMAQTITIKNSEEKKQFLRFLVVGGSGTLVDFCIFTLLKMLGVGTLAANTISFAAGTVNNFTWNRLWTFRGARERFWGRQFLQFAVVSLVGLGLNNLIVIRLEGVFGSMGLFEQFSYVPAKVIATGMVVFWNYFGNKLWTFGD
jgi:putative flippase GtrA